MARSLRVALRWFVASTLLAPLALSIGFYLYLLVELRDVTGRVDVGEVIIAPLVASVLYCVPTLLCALGCLPGFLLVPWVVHHVPWLDRSFWGAFLLSLVLAIPAALVFGELGFLDHELTVFAYLVGVLAIAAPRLIFRSLRASAFGASVEGR